MNFLSLIICLGLIVFALFQLKKLVEVIKKRKQEKNKNSTIDNDTDLSKSSKKD